MTPEQIIQSAEQCADSFYSIKDACINIATKALTNGWMKVDELPNFSGNLILLIRKGENSFTINGYADNDRLYDEGNNFIYKETVLYWKYDDANDIIKLLDNK